MATIIPSLLSAAATLLVCLINNHYQRIESEKKHTETITLIEYRLNELSNRVDKHNQIVERTYELEKKSCIAEAELKRIDQRLEEVGRGVYENK